MLTSPLDNRRPDEGMGMRSSRTVSAAALLATAAALAGCSGSDTGATTDPVKWDTARACDLADDATLAPLLTVGVDEGTEADSSGRVTCSWGSAEQLNTVAITLTSAPQTARELRTVDVAGLTGRVLAESKYQCIVEFETDSGVLSVETKFGLDATGNPDTSCDRAVPLAEHALGELGWTA
ncbi:hypothetical protein SAMN05444695_105213 [Rhodococcus triatomae]|uniref:DUF3558 domain-containing protein n=2 Tax=Rhodococcus triatomae TaxID=300028 RepID=A0A1G8IAC5_9NOCA|nr:hypothetical protein SAMN05444695_105213 [Rhodococcus triatomae]